MLNSIRPVIALLTCFIFGVLAYSNAAQTKPKQDAPDQAIQLQTKLIELHAVVTDKQGKVINNLKKEEFQILENNRPQELSFFSVVNVDAGTKDLDKGRPQSKLEIGAPEPPARTIVLFVDLLHLSVSSMDRSKHALHQFVNTQMTEHDLAAIVTSTGQLGILEQFTRDKKTLNLAIDRLTPLFFKETNFSAYLANLIERGDFGALATGAGIVQVEDSIRDKRPFPYTRAKAREVLTTEAQRRKAVLNSLKEAVDQLAQVPGQRLLSLISDGFSLYDESGGIDTTELRAVTSRAVRAGVLIYSIYAKGLTVRSSRYAGGAEYAAQDSLNALSRDTGAERFFNTNDIGGALQKTMEQNRNYYQLAYYPADDSDAKKLWTITVKVANHPEYEVRSQRGYAPIDLVDQKIDDSALTPQQRLFKAIARPLPSANIRTFISAAYIENETENAQVQLRLIIDANSIEYEKTDDLSRFSLNVVTVIHDQTGNPLKTISDKMQGNLHAATLDRAMLYGFQYIKWLNLKPGLYQVRTGIQQPSTGKIGTATAWLVVPDLSKRELTMSSVLLAENLSGKDGAAGRDASIGEQPKFVQGIRYYKRGSLLTCFFMLYNTAAESTAATLQFDLLRDEQSILQVPARPVASYVFGKNKKGLELQDQIKLDVPPGLYEFRVSVRDRRPNQPIQQSVVFGVED